MPAEIQPELFRAKGQTPKADDFVALLRGRGWMKGRTISALTGWPDRTLRILASASDCIGSGDEGYKLTDEMTREEYEHFRLRWRSQARKMIARLVRCDRHFYSRPAAA